MCPLLDEQCSQLGCQVHSAHGLHSRCLSCSLFQSSSSLSHWNIASISTAVFTLVIHLGWMKNHPCRKYPFNKSDVSVDRSFLCKEEQSCKIRRILQYNPYFYKECTWNLFLLKTAKTVRTGRFLRTALHTTVCLSRCICQQFLRKASTCWALQTACAHEH